MLPTRRSNTAPCLWSESSGMTEHAQTWWAFPLIGRSKADLALVPKKGALDFVVKQLPRVCWVPFSAKEAISH